MDATETSIDQAVVEQKHELYNPPLINATCVFSISIGYWFKEIKSSNRLQNYLNFFKLFGAENAFIVFCR